MAPDLSQVEVSVNHVEQALHRTNTGLGLAPTRPYIIVLGLFNETSAKIFGVNLTCTTPFLSSFCVELAFAQSAIARERNLEGHFAICPWAGSQDISAQQQAGLNSIQSPRAEEPHPLLKIRNKNHGVVWVGSNLQRPSKCSPPVMGRENFTSSKPHPK